MIHGIDKVNLGQICYIDKDERTKKKVYTKKLKGM